MNSDSCPNKVRDSYLCFRWLNHVYGYDIPLSQRAERKLIDLFLDETEKRRSAMEAEYRGNVQHSLKTIIQRLDENKQ